MGGFSGTSEIGNQSLQRLPEASRIAIKTFDALLRLRTWAGRVPCCASCWQVYLSRVR